MSRVFCRCIILLYCLTSYQVVYYKIGTMVLIRQHSMIESTKTKSMEDVSTEVLEKNKEYLRSKDKAKK